MVPAQQIRCQNRYAAIFLLKPKCSSGRTCGHAMISTTISMESDFDRWNEIKKRLARNAPTPPAFPKSGEVWMCTLGKNLGRKQNGSSQDFSRPVLVVKKFNNEIFWVVPLSTKQKPLDFYFNYNDPSGAPVAAILAQLRLVSVNRFRRDIYALPVAQLREVRARLRAFMT